MSDTEDTKPKAKTGNRKTSAKKTAAKKATAKKATTSKAATSKATTKSVKATAKKKTGAKKVAVKKQAAKKKTAGKKAAKKTVTATISYAEYREKIALAAYFIAEKRLFEHGLPEQDWLQAEAQVAAELAQEGIRVKPE